MEIIARRLFSPIYIYFDIAFLVLFLGLLIYKKKYMTVVVGLLAGVLYFLVDYGIFHLLLHTRTISEGHSLFWVLLWMSLSYGFTNFTWIWLWISKDKNLFAALAGAAGALYGLNFSSLQASKFDFNTSILILVFVVLGGLGNIWGSLIAAAALTILPEALRQFSDYRMLVYAIVLILVMLLTNNPTLRSVLSRLRPGASKEKEAA